MSKERREYFRIEDKITLDVSAIDSSTLETRIADFWNESHEHSIRNEFNHEIAQHLSDINAIELKMPELARYLGVLQKQIERLTETMLPEDNADSIETRTVSLSAQGLGFEFNQTFEVGQLVDLKIKLLPSGLKLVILARVVLSELVDSSNPGQYRISLNFDHIHESDKELLIKHIHGLQMHQLRSARNKSE